MTSIPPPRAPKRPKNLETHGDIRVDDWYWMREKTDPAVTAHLEAENAYTAHKLEHTKPLQEQLYQEFLSRIEETDLSVPVRKGAWWYYTRTEEGKQYPIHCRKADGNGIPSGDEYILLDENLEAGEGFFSLGNFDIDPANAQLLAYNVDRQGDEIFTMRFRDLQTGSDLADVIEHTQYGGAWSRDAAVYFYTRPDASQRPFQVWRHRIGTEATVDELIFQEDDQRFFVGVGNSKSEEYVVIEASSSLTSEVRLLRSDDPFGEVEVVEPRREGVEYHLSHHSDRFYVLTNEDAPNFRLMITPVDAPSRANWTEIIPHRQEVKLEDVETFRNHLVLSERMEAVATISVMDLESGKRSVIEQEEDVYTAWGGGNPEFDTAELRFNYTSLVTPKTVYSYDMDSGERTVLKQQPVPGGHDPADYVTTREWTTTADGTSVPISIVYRKDRAEGAGPALLYGYGSYEITVDPYFSPIRLSLLDRGFVFAIAHVRGGGDMGRLWYEHGKFFETRNRFSDLVACAEHLIACNYTSASQLVIRGGSAGGLLMGATVNERPDLFGAVVAEVPFVDVLTTMLDPELPLTVHEYEEWGNPEEKDYYDYIKSYSPYDNVTSATYPPVLATAGLNDPRVSYWEPAKWVQKLRAHNTAPTQVLLKTEMGAGHQGPSGRYEAWRDEAFVYAFILDALGLSS